jgi:hypothetical protein
MGDHPRIVGVLDGPELDPRVVRYEVVQPLRSNRRRGQRLVAMSGLALAGDHTGLDEVDEALAEQFGGYAEAAVVPQHPHHLVGHRPDPDLQRAVVRNPFRDKRCDQAPPRR